MTLPSSAFPLSVSGARLLGADGSGVSLGLGVNWGGAQQDELLPYGLDRLHRSKIIDRITGWGMSHVRFPFALGTFVTNDGTPKTAPAKASRLAANPDLQGLTPASVYQILTEDMTAAGLFVMPNAHLKFPGWPVPQTTQILTRSGWKSWHEIEPGIDQTLGRADDGTLQWTPVLQVRTQAQRPVIRIGTTRWSAVCTPDHRWLVQQAFPRNDRPVEWSPVTAEPACTAWTSKRTSRGIAGTRRLVLTGYAAGGKSGCTPDEARLIAWILGDGNLTIRNNGSTYQAYIAQSASKHATEIRALVTRTGFLSSEVTRQTGHGREVCLFRLRNRAVRELWQYLDDGLLSFVLSLSQEARAAWLDAWRKAEGSAEVIYQNPGEKQEAIALTAFLEGYLPQRVNGERHKGVSLGTRRVSNGPGLKWIYENAGLADVWCPTTGLGSWVARDEDGRIFLTGNCCSQTDNNGIWYNDNWPSSTFTNTWIMVAEWFRDNPMVGYDLHNEPRPATIGGALRTPAWGSNWSGSFPTDFRDMYQNTISRLRAVETDISHLMFCEGLAYAGDLSGWGAKPVTGANIVASVHDYSWYHQNADGSQQSKADYYAANDAKWGYLLTQGKVPVWVGEFGSNTDASTAAQGSGWLPSFLAYYADRQPCGACWWELSATTVLGTEPSTNKVKMAAGQREGFGLMSGQDWLGSQADMLALIGPVIA